MSRGAGKKTPWSNQEIEARARKKRGGWQIYRKARRYPPNSRPAKEEQAQDEPTGPIGTLHIKSGRQGLSVASGPCGLQLLLCQIRDGIAPSAEVAQWIAHRDGKTIPLIRLLRRHRQILDESAPYSGGALSEPANAT